MFSTMMMNDSTPLQFNNIDAELYGADFQARWEISDSWQLESVVSYVRGTRDDTNDELYRIAPLNGSLTATYTRNTWHTSIELEAASAQNKVSAINNEKSSAGYSLWNIHSQKALTDNLILSAGVKNISDKVYADHLTGINRAAGSGIPIGDRTPGNGRNIYTRISYKF